MSLRHETAQLAAAQLSAEDCEVLHARSGELAAFTPLMRRHYAEVLGVATRHAPAEHLGEDIASETFIFAWQHFERFTIGGDFGAWVRTIAWQLARARREREGCRQRQLERYTAHYLTGGTAGASARVRERATDVLEVLATLSPQRRELVYLCDYEGLTYQEAASGFGRTAAWVRSSLHHARRQVRAAFSSSPNS
jgi:RNA polymerase sigma factor (sigma-70 family)